MFGQCFDWRPAISCAYFCKTKKSDNELTGKLPRGDDIIPGKGRTRLDAPAGGQWSDLTNLQLIMMNDNNLSGILPPEMLYGLRHSLNRYVFYNLWFFVQIFVTISYRQILDWIAFSQVVGVFKFKSNLFLKYHGSDFPPTVIAVFLHVRLDIAYNAFEGSIPPEIGTMSKLRRLDATGNRFNGSLP